MSLLGLGAEPKTLGFLQMTLRAIIIYLGALAMMRLGGDRRFGGRYTDFDVVLSITFGSLLSRAINGSGPLWVTLVAGCVLVAMNRIFAFIAGHSRLFSQLISGKSLTLIQDGKIQSDNMSKAHISQTDLMSAIRSNAHLSELSEVKVARLERSGQVSVIPAAREPQVIEVKVEKGVQTVRLQLEYPAGGEKY